MRLAVSNIAWEVADDAAAAALFERCGVDAVDLAPGKYFPDPESASPAEIAAVRRRWNDRGLAVTGMQSLLFGTQGLNLFGPPEVRSAMLRRLEAVCRIGSGLGAACLVFGSPKNRDRGDLTPAETERMAQDFFADLGERAARHGVVLCLEPNPTRYGCNFLTGTREAADFVARLGHPAIRLQLDTGTLTVNGEAIAPTVAACAGLVAHVHASEPDLVPLGDGGTDHAAAGRALARHLPERVVAVEMLATRHEPPLAAVERALALAARHYRDAPAPEDASP